MGHFFFKGLEGVQDAFLAAHVRGSRILSGDLVFSSNKYLQCGVGVDGLPNYQFRGTYTVMNERHYLLAGFGCVLSHALH